MRIVIRPMTHFLETYVAGTAAFSYVYISSYKQYSGRTNTLDIVKCSHSLLQSVSIRNTALIWYLLVANFDVTSLAELSEQLLYFLLWTRPFGWLYSHFQVRLYNDVLETDCTGNNLHCRDGKQSSIQFYHKSMDNCYTFYSGRCLSSLSL